MFCGRLNIFETLNINFAICLYMTPWSSADSDDSALSAATEFQVVAFGEFPSKISAVSKLTLIYVQSNPITQSALHYNYWTCQVPPTLQEVRGCAVY
jgi:hypothetical protein